MEVRVLRERESGAGFSFELVTSNSHDRSARLKLARVAAGLSLRALADRIDSLVSAQATVKYERDEMTPSPPVPTALTSAFGGSEGYLLNPDDVSLVGFEFRTPN